MSETEGNGREDGELAHDLTELHRRLLREAEENYEKHQGYSAGVSWAAKELSKLLDIHSVEQITTSQDETDRIEKTDDEDETTIEKGNRNENQAKNILKRAYGAGVEKVDAWGNHDPFGFVDLIAISEDEPVKFVQVKTNRFTEEQKRKYRSRTRHLPHEHATFEVWVRYDFSGWELFQFDGENFDQYAKLPSNESDAGEAFRSLRADTERGESDE